MSMAITLLPGSSSSSSVASFFSISASMSPLQRGLPCPQPFTCVLSSHNVFLLFFTVLTRQKL